MGNLLSSLLPSSYPSDAFIDLENASPTDNEQKIHAEMKRLINQGEERLKDIQDYKGCREEQRAAMMGTTPDAEAKCFEKLLESVAKIKSFYDHSQDIEQNFPRLLNSICSMTPEGKATLANQQALVKQAAEIFNFTLLFDEQRMKTPSLPNDFSYYRRLLTKIPTGDGTVWANRVTVGDEEASTMAMFTSEHLPMMTAVAKAASHNSVDKENVKTGLALLANSCMKMIKDKKFSSKETNLFCARAMTGAIVVYDRISEFGVFHKRCSIALRESVQLLKSNFADEPALINAIHFSTITFRNADASTQALFE